MLDASDIGFLRLVGILVGLLSVLIGLVRFVGVLIGLVAVFVDFIGVFVLVDFVVDPRARAGGSR